MSSSEDLSRAGLGPDAFLEHLRSACRSSLRSNAASELRCSCDMWTISPKRADPIEPLTNRGRSAITWPPDTWSSISTDLLGAAHRAADDESASLPAALVEYAVFVHLELTAAEEPPMGVRTEAFVLPLVIAARQRARSEEFRRYALAWRERAGSLPWNDPEMGFAASLVVSLGSIQDPVIGAWVGGARERLNDDARQGRARYRDLVRSDLREHWRRAASASSPDAAEWASGFMR